MITRADLVQRTGWYWENNSGPTLHFTHGSSNPKQVGPFTLFVSANLPWFAIWSVHPTEWTQNYELLRVELPEAAHEDVVDLALAAFEEIRAPKKKGADSFPSAPS